jgi:predicted nucleic acid-binding protein
MIQRAKYLFREFTQAKTKVLIPSIVIGEFLLGIPSNMHGAFLSKLGEGGFRIAPYDLQAAARFAALWKGREERNIIQKLKVDFEATRIQSRADCMIVATALAQKSSCIYSHDRRLKAFACDAIHVYKLPTEQRQYNLF